MQAIETEYKGPTDTRGSRIIVRAQAGRMVVPWDHALNPDANHRAAILAFIKRWGLAGHWICGGRADGKGTVAVCVKRSGKRFRMHPTWIEADTAHGFKAGPL